MIGQQVSGEILTPISQMHFLEALCVWICKVSALWHVYTRRSAHLKRLDAAVLSLSSKSDVRGRKKKDGDSWFYLV